MDTKVHWYIDINEFNVILPKLEQIKWEWPCISAFFGIQIEGRLLHRTIAWIVGAIILLPIFAAIDIAKRISADLIVYLVKIWVIDGIKKMFETVLDSVVKKFLGVVGIAIAIFLIYVFIKSGIWQSFYDWLLSLWQ